MNVAIYQLCLWIFGSPVWGCYHQCCFKYSCFYPHTYTFLKHASLEMALPSQDMCMWSFRVLSPKVCWWIFNNWLWSCCSLITRARSCGVNTPALSDSKLPVWNLPAGKLPENLTIASLWAPAHVAHTESFPEQLNQFTLRPVVNKF